jgi:hypothetical protein
MANQEPRPTEIADLPRTDRPVDLPWWTRKLFEELVFSRYGEFDPIAALDAIKDKYGVPEPDDDAYWHLQNRSLDVAEFDEHDFNDKGGDMETLIQQMTRYDDLEGEQ